MTLQHILVLSLVSLFGVCCAPALVAEQPTQAKVPPMEVTFQGLVKEYKACAGKQITVTCFVATNVSGSTRLYERLDAAIESGPNFAGRLLTIKDPTLALWPTPPRCPLWCKVTGVFRSSPDLQKDPESQWLGTFDKIDLMEILQLTDEMVRAAEDEIAKKVKDRQSDR